MWGTVPYTTAEDLASWLGVDVDAEASMAIESASRAIDQASGRQFGYTGGVRDYVPKFHRGRWYVDVDDMPEVPATVNLIHQDGTVIREITDYVLTPRNALADRRPYTRLEFGGIGSYGYFYGEWRYPHQVHHLVQVVGGFGWSAIPQPIVMATLMQAARFLERREMALPLTSQRVDDVSYSFGQSLDPDIEASIAPFKRWWGAV